MKNIFLIAIASVLLLTSCSDGSQYLVDGGLSQSRVDKTTVDFFRSHEQLDTLAILIERAGMEDVFNGNATVFAPNNNSIRLYVEKVLADMRAIDPQAEFDINDIPQDTLTKYMGSYVFPGKIKRENMTEQGKIYTANNGEERRVSLEPVEAYTDELEEYPEYVFITYKVGTEWDVWNDGSVSTAEKDDKFLIRTSNIESNTGMIHVIQGNHRLFNYDPD